MTSAPSSSPDKHGELTALRLKLRSRYAITDEENELLMDFAKARPSLAPTEGFYEKLWKDFVGLQRGDAVGTCEKVEAWYRAGCPTPPSPLAAPIFRTDPEIRWCSSDGTINGHPTAYDCLQDAEEQIAADKDFYFERTDVRINEVPLLKALLSHIEPQEGIYRTAIGGMGSSDPLIASLSKEVVRLVAEVVNRNQRALDGDKAKAVLEKYPDQTPLSATRPKLTGFEHDLKCWVGFFQDVLDKRKGFEIRNNDRNYKVGDTLLLREWSPDEKVYTGRSCRRVVTYITSWEQKPGFVVLSVATDEGAKGKS